MLNIQKIANIKILSKIIFALFLIANISFVIHNITHCKTTIQISHTNDSNHNTNDENDCKVCTNLKLNNNLHLNNITIDFSIASENEIAPFILDKKESYSLLTISNKAPPAL